MRPSLRWLTTSFCAANPLMEQTTRLASLMAPVPGTPFDSNIICISEKPHRTIKWMLAVAAGVLCVKWTWVHECIKYGKLLDPTPYLLRLDADGEIAPRPPQKRMVFDGKKVELHGAHDWKTQWALVLREQGAEVVDRIGVGNERYVASATAAAAAHARR